LLGIRKSPFVCSKEVGDWGYYAKLLRKPVVFESLGPKESFEQLYPIMSGFKQNASTL